MAREPPKFTTVTSPPTASAAATRAGSARLSSSRSLQEMTIDNMATSAGRLGHRSAHALGDLLRHQALHGQQLAIAPRLSGPISVPTQRRHPAPEPRCLNHRSEPPEGRVVL